MKTNSHPADDKKLDALAGERFEDSPNIEFRHRGNDVRPRLPET